MQKIEKIKPLFILNLWGDTSNGNLWDIVNFKSMGGIEYPHRSMGRFFIKNHLWGDFYGINLWGGGIE